MADEKVVRVRAEARLALVREASGRTRWVPYTPVDEQQPTASPPIELRSKATASSVGAGRLDWDASCFPGTPKFSQIAVDDDTPPPQNVLLFLHGRGDSHEPFARLGAQMALPQTAVVSLQAPLQLPFGLGYSWMEDLDDTGDVIPPDVSHAKRSRSLQAARDYVWRFLHVLHENYGWSYSRLFVFGFSQGACVAFQVAMTLPRDVRLGGVVLVAGGAIVGPHSSASTGGGAATPMLQVTGTADRVYPIALAERSRLEFRRRCSQKAMEELFTSVVRPHKAHAMIDSPEDMQQVMLFFSKHLYLRNEELENRSDVVELQM